MEYLNIFDMIQLLKQQISYLKDFQQINQEEEKRIYQGDTTNLEAFYYDRELLLNAVDKINKKLKIQSIDQYVGVGNIQKDTVRELLKEKRKILHDILNQDMEIHSRINSYISDQKTKIA